MLITLSNNMDPDQAPHSVQTILGSKLFDTFEVMTIAVEPMYCNFGLNFNMTLSFADNPFKQFGPRPGPTFCPDLTGVKTV